MLLGLGASAQTTAWSSSPAVTPQTRTLSGAKQIRWIWGSSSLFSLPDTLALFGLKTDSSKYLRLNSSINQTATATLTQTANNQPLTGWKFMPTFANGGFTQGVWRAAEFGGGVLFDKSVSVNGPFKTSNIQINIGSDTTSNYIVFRDSAGVGKAAFFSNTGNWTFGDTTTNTYKLFVNGTFATNSSVYFTGLSTGTIVSGQFLGLNSLGQVVLGPPSGALSPLTPGQGLLGSNYNGSTAITFQLDSSLYTTRALLSTYQTKAQNVAAYLPIIPNANVNYNGYNITAFQFNSGSGTNSASLSATNFSVSNSAGVGTSVTSSPTILDYQANTNSTPFDEFKLTTNATSGSNNIISGNPNEFQTPIQADLPITLAAQSTTPTAPAINANLIYGNSTGVVTFMGHNGFGLSLGKGHLTASHKVEFQNKDYTAADSADVAKTYTVATVSALQAYSGTATTLILTDSLRGKVINTFNYYPGVTANDGGINFTATGKGSGTWVRAWNGGIVYPEWWGAVPDYNPVTHTGTDNRAAIQSAINSRPHHAGNVWISGRFSIADSLVVGEATTIQGDNGILTTQFYAGPDTGYFRVPSEIHCSNVNANTIGFEMESVSYRAQKALFQNLTLSGASFNGGGTKSIVNIENNPNATPSYNSGANLISFINVYFQDDHYGLNGNNAGILNVVSYCHFAGFDIAANDGIGKLRMFGSIFWQINTRCLDLTGFEDDISGCYFQPVSTTEVCEGIYLHSSPNATYTEPRDINIHNNYFYGGTKAIRATSGGNIDIYHNQTDFMTDTVFDLQNVYTSQVYGNILTNRSNDDSNIPFIYAKNCPTIKLLDNTFNNPAAVKNQYGILLDGTTCTAIVGSDNSGNTSQMTSGKIIATVNSATYLTETFYGSLSDGTGFAYSNVSNSLTVGADGSSTVGLNIRGFASGGAGLNLSRSGGVSAYKFGMGAETMFITDSISNKVIMSLGGATNNSIYAGAIANTTADTRQSLFRGGTYTGGTDMAGNITALQGQIGTGAGASAFVIIQGAVPTTSGTTAQTYGDLLRLNYTTGTTFDWKGSSIGTLTSAGLSITPKQTGTAGDSVLVSHAGIMEIISPNYYAKTGSANTFTGVQTFSSNPIFNTTSVVGQLWTATGTSGHGAWATIANKAHTIFTPTTGGTVALVNNQTNIINPSGSLLALTVTLPSSPTNNDEVRIKFTQSVTTVTYSGGTVVDGITSPIAGGYVVLTYDSGTTSWY
jgi:hypothetical protein